MSRKRFEPDFVVPPLVIELPQAPRSEAARNEKGPSWVKSIQKMMHADEPEENDNYDVRELIGYLGWCKSPDLEGQLWPILRLHYDNKIWDSNIIKKLYCIFREDMRDSKGDFARYYKDGILSWDQQKGISSLVNTINRGEESYVVPKVPYFYVAEEVGLVAQNTLALQRGQLTTEQEFTRRMKTGRFNTGLFDEEKLVAANKFEYTSDMDTLTKMREEVCAFKFTTLDERHETTERPNKEPAYQSRPADAPPLETLAPEPEPPASQPKRNHEAAGLSASAPASKRPATSGKMPRQEIRERVLAEKRGQIPTGYIGQLSSSARLAGKQPHGYSYKQPPRRNVVISTLCSNIEAQRQTIMTSRPAYFDRLDEFHEICEEFETPESYLGCIEDENLRTRVMYFLLGFIHSVTASPNPESLFSFDVRAPLPTGRIVPITLAFQAGEGIISESLADMSRRDRMEAVLQSWRFEPNWNLRDLTDFIRSKCEEDEVKYFNKLLMEFNHAAFFSFTDNRDDEDDDEEDDEDSDPFEM